MKARPTGIGAFGFSVNWETVSGDADVARRVVNFLENRRVLFGDRQLEHEMSCLASAIEVRGYLTSELNNATPGKSLDASLRAMRVAFREFADAAGTHAQYFRRDSEHFYKAIEKMRTLVGLHLAVIAHQYHLAVEPDLAQIFPPEVDGNNEA